ncbi:hypothetical protein EMPS_10244 [Entomortierella parvispora]|uniref:Pentacotripeptide-repeat region of PRORP domain-containing protein n=1 Tax=Entomortierella parvispora TaxID=205924 RepID=A0A9P3HJT8_9FUNG|nr:hypothetical protein EMPS_10244 [Entomortierella parvispora]
MASPSIPWSDTPGPQCLMQTRLDTRGIVGHTRRAARKPLSDMQGRNHTFSDLYPIFRSLLEKRHLSTHHPNQHPSRRALAQLSRNSGRSRSVVAPSDSPYQYQPQQIIGAWEHPVQISPRRTYSTGHGGSATIPATFRKPSNLPRRISPIALQERASRSTYSSHRPIPFRTMSHQSSTRLFEEIISPSGIQDDYHSIIETPLPTPRPSSAGVIKEWIKSQLSLAREHFKRQNYMQAMGVIEKARDHDYLSMLSTFPKYSASVKQSRWHLQDLALVEYCCKLAYLHESQIGNIDMVGTMNQLNSAILAPAGNFTPITAPGFRTSFQEQNDPLVDQTLAIIMRSWTDTWDGLSMSQMSDLATSTPREQIALATAFLPFIQAITARRLFPASTSLLLDTTATSLLDSPRKMALEVCLIAGDDRCAMDWIKLWSWRDYSDWLQCWSNVDFKQLLARNLCRIGKEDCVIDIVRLSHKSRRNWLQDLVVTLATVETHVMEPPALSLSNLFELADLDATFFHHKLRFYKDLKLERTDLMESWIIGARHFDLSKSQAQNQAERDLWNELTMVGVFAKDLTLDDVLRSVKHRTPIKHERDNRQDFRTADAQILNSYSDPLTLYLESIASTSHSELAATTSVAEGDHSKTGAQAILAKAIQNLMSSHNLKNRDHRMTEYRNLLLDVSQSVAERLGHLGLLSQISEAKFLAFHGKASWTSSVARLASKRDTRPSGGSIELKNPVHSSDAINFVKDSLTSDLSKWCAASVAISGLSNIKWKGRFSDWFMDMAGSLPRSGPMARALQYQGRLDPASGAYQIALWTLVKDKEYDLAATLHSNAYRLFDAHDQMDVAENELFPQPKPSSKEIGMLVSALARSDQDPKHLNQAQSIVDRHLETERYTEGTDLHPLIDIQTMTELAGAWSRRADFAQLRHVIETMERQGLQPNMVFYNTLLKSLVDLAPLFRDGARTLGSGSNSETRELGRDLMVRQLLRSRMSATQSESGMIDGRSELQEGWEIFQSLVSRKSGRPLRLPTLSGQDLDSPTALKSLVLDPELTQHTSFTPDAFTFSILLGAFAQRGEIESISELFGEMKVLGIEPDEFICTILAHAFAKRGDLRSVNRVLQEARNRRMNPGLPLSNMILNSLVEMNAPIVTIRDALDRMIAEFGRHDSMDSDQEVEIPVRKQDLLNPRFHPLLSDAVHDRAGATKSRHQTDSKLTLDAVTMTTLIKYHARQDDLRSAQDIFETMIQAGLVPGQHVYVHLIAACIRGRDVESGVSVIRTMRSESGLQADAKAWKGLFRCALELEAQAVAGIRSKSYNSNSRSFYRPSLGDSHHNDSPKRPQPVSIVLQELCTVVEGLLRCSDKDMEAKNGTNVAHDYLWKVLTSSWITMKGIDEPPMPLSTKKDSVLSSEVKGRHGLLRRLLDHLLRDAKTKEPKPSKGATEDVLTSPSIPRRRKHKGFPISEAVESKASEANLDVRQRCEQAIRLVRLVEATGIELGPQWKWDVVIRRIRFLTGEDSASILKRLQPYDSRRKILKESVSS